MICEQSNNTQGHVLPAIASDMHATLPRTTASSVPMWQYPTALKHVEVPDWMLTSRAPTIVVSVSAVVAAFLSAVRSLPQVQQILVDDIINVQHIVTVIASPPFEPLPRMQIYDAQLAALEMAGYPAVHFRLINTHEMGDDLGAIVPTSYRIVYRGR